MSWSLFECARILLLFCLKGTKLKVGLSNFLIHFKILLLHNYISKETDLQIRFHLQSSTIALKKTIILFVFIFLDLKENFNTIFLVDNCLFSTENKPWETEFLIDNKYIGKEEVIFLLWSPSIINSHLFL